MTGTPTVRVTLAGIRSPTHLVHAGGYLRHLLATTTGAVVVDYLGSGSFLGRDNVRREHLDALLPGDLRLTVLLPGEDREVAGGRREGRRVLLCVGAPGIKPYARLVLRERSRPEVVVVDEGIGSYGTWRTRRDAWRRQGGREPWPTVRSWAVTAASRLLTDRRWALYERVGVTWRVVPEVAAAFAEVTPVTLTARGPDTYAVYLTQPWVELGLVTDEEFATHLQQVAAACAEAGLVFAVRPHPAERAGRYTTWRELARDLPAELDPAVLGAALVIGTDSTALLNLAAVRGRPALRVSVPQLSQLEQGLGQEQRGLLDAFLPRPVDARDVDGLARAIERALTAEPGP